MNLEGTCTLAAAPLQPPDPVVDADEHAWLERFLLYAAVIAGFVAVAGALVAVVTQLQFGPEIATIGMAAVLSPVMLIATLVARRGRPAAAAMIVTGLFLAVSVAIVLAIPAAVAQPSIIAVLGFVVARQYVRGTALRAAAVVCWLVATLDIVLLVARSGLGESWIDYAFGVLPMSVTLGLLIAMLMLFAERTRQALETERATGAELEASRRFAEGVTEAVPGLVLVYEPTSGRMTYGNADARAWVGSGDPGEPNLAGIVERGVHPDEQPAVQAWRLDLAAATDDETRTATARLLMPEGWRWYDIRGTVFRRAPDGTPTHVLALGIDATRERTATIQRDRFFDISGDAFVVIGSGARILAASPSLAPMLGVTEAELVGLNVREVGHPDDRATAEELMLRLLHEQTRGSATLRHRNLDGEWRSIEWTLALDRDGLVYGVARDVTERLATHDALEKVRRLETVGRLAGGVAHDVNNSLTAIGGFASLIGDTSAEPETRELAGHIRASVDRTAMMTRKLLAFSRRQPVDPRVVDLAEILRDLRPMVTQLMTEAVSVQLETGPTPGVLVDPAGIEQVVMNLAVNARDAMPSGGTLILRTGTARVVSAAEPRPGGLPPGIYAELLVIDTGTGMPESVRQRIFEPFFSTKGEAGTGLGLAIVHGLVTGAGGAVEVRSAPDRGTTFRILLPEAALPVPASGVAAAAPVVAAPRRHVLLVEDEPTIRRLGQVVLERAGHRVSVAAGGGEALEVLGALEASGDPEPVALVITDIVMPGMSGIELAERIREAHPDLPIAFASGYDQGLLPTEGPFAGARLLEKPYSPATLVAAVAETLR